MGIDWAQRSGLWRPTPSGNLKTSNDKPELNFGIPHLDDGTVKEMLNTTIAVQPRNLVIMEVQSNLVKKDRIEHLQRLRMPSHKKVAKVMMGDPIGQFKDSVLKAKLKAKQEKAEAA